MTFEPSYIDPSLWGVSWLRPGVRGVNRAPVWDAVAAAHAPLLTGDDLRFAVGADGDVRAEVPVETIEPLRHAITSALEPPLCAIAVRDEGDVWSVAANRADIVELPVRGEEIAVTRIGDEITATIDGEESDVSFPGLEGLLEGDCTVMAHRFVGSSWVAETFPL